MEKKERTEFNMGSKKPRGCDTPPMLTFRSGPTQDRKKRNIGKTRGAEKKGRGIAHEM